MDNIDVRCRFEAASCSEELCVLYSVWLLEGSCSHVADGITCALGARDVRAHAEEQMCVCAAGALKGTKGQGGMGCYKVRGQID